MVRKFWKEERGNVAILFGLAAVPVVFAVGSGIDVSTVVSAKQRAQIALDSAALAVNTQSYAYVEGDIATVAQSVFEANFNSPATHLTEFTATKDDAGKINVSAELSVSTSFSPLIGIDQLSFIVQSESVVGEASFDVVMVLDNSGSMGGSKIATLKTAAKDLTDTLLAANTAAKPDRVQIGVVPFTAYVNVGADKADATWMDLNGVSPLNGNNFDGTTPRLDVFDQISGVSWQGCVEARPYPYDVQDTAASEAVPETMFVPEFAPDEPDNGGYSMWGNYYSYKYSNNWLDDDGGSCSGSVNADGVDGHNEKQKRLCKYNSVSYSPWDNGVSKGPNYGCKTQQITAMTNDGTTLKDAIDDMEADGYTNIHQGVVWGWRAMSPQAPFTEGRVTDDPLLPKHRRIMIVMTDGANTYEWKDSNPNISKYNAYGYVPEGRVGTTENDYTTVRNTMNARSLEACTNAKNDGDITVFTIAFQVNDTATRDMLESCASDATLAYQSGSNEELSTAFLNIAKEITRLRLSR